MSTRSHFPPIRRISLCLPPQGPSTAMSSPRNVYVRGRGSFTSGISPNPGKPPHVILPVTPTPPPLPPPPPNPQLKPRSHSQQWTSSRSFGNKLPVRSQSVKATPPKSRNTQPPPRPLTRPRLPEERGGRAEVTELPPFPTNLPPADPNSSTLRQDVFRVTVYVFHSSLLVVSYVAWAAILILLLPAIGISYCLRQLGLLLAQHRRPALVDTLSSLSLQYLEGKEASTSAVTVVAIYLGSPGIKIAALKRLLAERILSKSSVVPSSRRPAGRWFAERLQQKIVELPTGYAWQRCTAVNIDDHVAPAYLVGQNRPTYGRRLSPKKCVDEEGMVEVEKDPVEILIGQLSTVALPTDKPLWQVHLVEDYYDSKDALTVLRMESPFSPTTWRNQDNLAPWSSRRPSQSPSDSVSIASVDRPMTRTASGFKRPHHQSSTASICSIRSHTGGGRLVTGPPQTGSLIIFRVHSAITDDAQSLVEFITILLSEGAVVETKANTQPQAQASSQSDLLTLDVGKEDKPEARRPTSLFKVRLSESSLEWDSFGGLPLTPPPPSSPDWSSSQSFRAHCTRFCEWIRVLNEIRRQVVRAIFFGPFVVLHNLLLVSADLGLLPSPAPAPPSDFEAATSVSSCQVFRRIQLPLEKVLHIQNVTRATLTEISMCLLAGALRAYQQTSGLTSPPDLHVRACSQTPNFDLGGERPTQPTYDLEIADSGGDGDESEQQEALIALSDIANGPPAQCVFAPMRLPLSAEGMLPRLWNVHRRVQLLRRSAVTLTLAWTRDLLHLILPHWFALRADHLLLSGVSKCSITYAEVSLESNSEVESVDRRTKSGRFKRSRNQHQSRRGQNSPKVDITQALRLVNRPGSPRKPIDLDSCLTERNLDLIYVAGGVPIVRIEAWIAHHRKSQSLDQTTPNHNEASSAMCRDLSVVSCVYGSHVTVGLTASTHLDGRPGIGLILNAMLQQLNQLYRLLDSRFPAKPVIYAPLRRPNFTSVSGSANTRIRVVQNSPSATTQSRNNAAQPSPSASHEYRKSGILVEEEGAQFLKYNFPPISTDLRRASFGRGQKRHSIGAPQLEDTHRDSSKPSKLVPILKATNANVGELTPTQSDDNLVKRKRIDGSHENRRKALASFKCGSKSGLQRRFGLAGKFKKKPVQPPPQVPRRSQVRFVTEDD
uniref:Diacylglycerol O-acyltransferase n=2 Tax=Mesocestoides corti TaxID=53468 RepID=A0A5K3FEC8_MESCO